MSAGFQPDERGLISLLMKRGAEAARQTGAMPAAAIRRFLEQSELDPR